MFKKLFTITYNNKKFLILVDKNHRKTFLEVKDENLTYPTLEDFKYLHKVYNEKDPLICYVTRYNYGERIVHESKLTSLFLAVQLGLLSITALSTGSKVDNVNAVYKDYEASQTYYSSIYQDTVTRKDVIRAINDNKNFNERERKIAYTVLDDMLKLDPDMNLRVYYENIKDLRIEYITYDDLHEETNEFIGGYYNSYDNYIKVVDDSSDMVIAHEIAHSAHNLVRQVDGESIAIYEGYGSFLAEAMTNKIASQSFDYNYTYYLEGLLLDYFLYNTNDFNYHTYNIIGIKGLIEELKSKYEDVDIDYIIDFFQTNTDTGIRFDEHINLCEETEVLDELFKIAIANINKDNPFESFKEFMKLTDNNSLVRDRYFEKYVEELSKIIKTNDFKIINSITNLVLVNNNVYISDGSFYFDYDGNRNPIDNALLIPIDTDLKDDLINGCINDKKIYSKEFVIDLLLSNVLYDRNIPEYLLSISHEQQALFLNTVFDIIIKNNDDYNELSRLYDAFTSLLLEDLNDNYMTDFYNKFTEAVIEKGGFTPEEYKTLKSIWCIVEHKGRYYLATRVVSDIIISQTYNYYESNSGFSKSTIISPTPISMECIDEDGNKFMLEIDDDVFNYYWLNFDAQEKLVEYFYNVKGSNKFSQENIDGYINYSNIKEISRYKNAFTFSDGRTIYDNEVDENIILQIGKDKEGKFVYKLLNKEEELYKSGDFEGNYATMPYMTYLKCCRSLPDNYIDDILDEKNIKTTLSFMVPVEPEIESKVEWYEVVVHNDSEVSSEDSVKYMAEILIDFIDPQKIILDDKEDYLRKTYIVTDIDLKTYVYFIDGSRMEITDELSVDLPEEGVYFEYFEKCLKHFKIEPNSNNAYNLTKEQIIEIAINYMNETLSKHIEK